MPFQEYIICQEQWQCLLENEIGKKLADAWVYENQTIKLEAVVVRMESAAQLKINKNSWSSAPWGEERMCLLKAWRYGMLKNNRTCDSLGAIKYLIVSKILQDHKHHFLFYL